MDITIPQINGITGLRHVPGDKSISHRALLIGGIAKGSTEIKACSRASDPLSTLSCIKQLGLEIDDHSDSFIIHGKGLHGFNKPTNPLNAGNSGTTMRLLSGILVGQRFPSILIGDSSLSRRPMKRIIDPLQEMGASIHGTENNTAPLKIEPVKSLQGISYELPVASAQVKSAILFAGLYAHGATTIREHYRSRDHTERMLGLVLHKKMKESLQYHLRYRLKGKSFSYPVIFQLQHFLCLQLLSYKVLSLTFSILDLILHVNA